MSSNLTPLSRPLSLPPVREDCWTEEASATLIDEWGRRYVELNRGNLRQKDWQEVADAVNSLHAHSIKTHRTGVQCKNRLDTIKRKYKVEKSRVLDSNGCYISNWVFFNQLDFLVGNKPSPSPLPVKRPEEPMMLRPEEPMMLGPEPKEGDGVRRLARAIEGFVRVYERVEGEKLKQMVELGKRRMEFEKEVEMQRMQMFVDSTKVRLERIKRQRKRSNDMYG